MSKTGRKPFGSTEAERAVIDIVRLASRKVRGGRVPTMQSIADKLNAAGHVTKSGKVFIPQTIAAIQERIAAGDFKGKPKRIKKTQLTSGDFRSEDLITSDLKALSEAGDNDLRRIYLALLGTGLRAAEFCDLRCGDVDAARRMLTVRKGKGGKQRVIVLSSETAHLFGQIMKGKGVRCPVFYSKFGKHLTYKSLYRRAQKIAAIIGDDTWHLQSMRHTFASRLYQYKKDLIFVAEQLGHSSIETTRIYAKTLNSEKLEQMDAMDKLGKKPVEPIGSG